MAVPSKYRAMFRVAVLALSLSPDSLYATLQADTYTIADNVNLVLLDVSVRDRSGHYAAGLGSSNFQVFEDGKEQKISHFSNVDAPVTVGLIVDNSGSMRARRPGVILAGLGFAKESNPQDEFFVVIFNDSVVHGLGPAMPFTDNLQTLRNALNFGEPRGRTALYDAVSYGLRHLELGHQEKRTLIVVSDGGDNVSQTPLEQLMLQIEASRATIYTVGLFDAENQDLNPRVLRKLTAVSGGEYFEPRALDEIVPVFNKISRDIRSRYSIAYVPKGAPKVGEVRSIKVMAQQNGHKLRVRTRTSYTTGPQEGLSARQD
jgi:VWFA-related protein